MAPRSQSAGNDDQVTVEQRKKHAVAPPPPGAERASSVRLLDGQGLRDLLDDPARAAFRDIHLLLEVDSTNRWLADYMVKTGVRSAVCLAESQRAGRGRRGRHWASPPGGNVYLSLGWTFDTTPRPLTGLGLMAGVVAASAIVEAGIEGIELKWPNDLVAGYDKVGGILVEMSSTGNGATVAVIGIGLNLRLSEAVRAQLDQPVTDLTALAQADVDRTPLVARILNGFARALPRFERGGLEPFREAWRRFDRTCERDVTLHGLHGSRAGRAIGIDDDGALLVHTVTGIERVHAEEVSLRVRS